jgi:phosphoglycolate phosphatase-like HAD superfamily hydrolase
MKNKLVIFDFDNTLVNTGDVIRKYGYDYSFESLSIYEGMLSILRSEMDGAECMILSARKRKWAGKIRKVISNFLDQSIEVKTVPRHWLKWFYLLHASMKFKEILLYDDMMYDEESGVPKKLFFPVFLPSNVQIIRGEDIIALRGQVLDYVITDT